MQYILALSLFFTACSLFSASTPNDQYIARKQSVTFGGTVLPCTLIPNQQGQLEPYFLLGRESYLENEMIVHSDFGGSNDPLDISAQHVALRELFEETRRAFGDDRSLNPAHTTKPDVEKNIAALVTSLRLRPYINRTLDNGKKVYVAIAKVPYKTPREILENVSNADEEKYKEMTHFMWVKAYPFLNTIAQTTAKSRQPGSREIVAPSIMVTNELNQQQRIAIRATFFLRIRPAANNAKIRAIVDQYVQNPY